MGNRIQQRVKAVLPVRVSGTTPRGETFDDSTYTLDISRTGAKLVLHKPVAIGDIVTVAYRQRKVRFQVKWLLSGDLPETIAGLVSTDPGVVLWTEIRKEEKSDYSDQFRREELERQKAVQQALNGPRQLSQRPGEPGAAGPAQINAQSSDRNLQVQSDPAGQVRDVASRLLALEPELLNHTIDSVLLRELRDALAKVSEAAWIAEQHAGLKKAETEAGQSLPLISVLNNDRLRTATRACNAFMGDLMAADLALDEKAVGEFLAVAEQLVLELALAVC